jgi:hypothetical protein
MPAAAYSRSQQGNAPLTTLPAGEGFGLGLRLYLDEKEPTLK